MDRQTYETLKDFARSLGSDLVQLPDRDFWEQQGYNPYTGVGIHHAPFATYVGILSMGGYAVVATGDDSDFFSDEPPTSVLHELGHVCVAGSADNYKGPAGQEYDEYEFFGWEWAAAKLLGLERDFISSNKEYSVQHNDSIDDFGTLSEADQLILLQSREDFAVEAGYILGGRPVRISPLLGWGDRAERMEAKFFRDSALRDHLLNLEHGIERGA